MPDEKKYTTNITLQNDSVMVMNGQGGSYNPEKDVIYIRKGDIDLKDFSEHAPDPHDNTLVIIHERQHQLNAKRGVDTAITNLTENYDRMCHNEVTALIAEKLEIRRQYKACKTDEEREACLKKFATQPDHVDYIQAIRSGRINPNSESSKDFNEEMAFIKNSAISYRADPKDDSYRSAWTKNSIVYLAQNGTKIKSNPEGLEQSVRLMYENIGGIDFNKIGRKDLHIIENQSIRAADKMLEQGAEPKKLIRFMQQGEGDFKLAESLDVTGLNQQQAETVLQTAIMTQSLAENVAIDLVTGEAPSYDYNYVAREAREKTAIYLDLKSDIWAKNDILTAEGNEQKFNELMKKAKEFTLDTSNFYNDLGTHIDSNQYDTDELKKRAKEMNGQAVNFDDIVKDQEGYKLPLTGTSKEDVIAQMDAKDEEDRKFWEEYYKKNPPEQPRISDPYEMEIMDLNSDILKDELAQREEAERKAEEERKRKEEEERKKKEEEEKKKKEQQQNDILQSAPSNDAPNLAENSDQPDAPSAPDNGITIRPAPYAKTKMTAPVAVYTDDGKHIIVNTPQYDHAEIKTTVGKNGETSVSTLIDGQKHGVEYTKDKDGNITDLSAYDHGKLLDLNNAKLELKSETRNGMTLDYTLLNGYVFGSEIMTDKDGNMTVAFYDASGNRIEEKATTQITQTKENLTPDVDTAAKETLHDDLKSQQGEIPLNPTAQSQNIRFGWHWEKDNQTKDKDAPWLSDWQQNAQTFGVAKKDKSETEEKPETEKRPQTTPQKAR